MHLETAQQLRIGIISDTHGYFHPSIPDAFRGVDCILHAGDLGGDHIFDHLQAIAPTTAVFGNVDGAGVRRMLKEHVEIELGGVRIWMTHIGGRPGRWSGGVPDQLRERKPDLFVCGHSHILRIERIDNPVPMLFLNPGAAGRQGLHKVKTCVVVSVSRGKLTQADVVRLDELPKNETIQSESPGLF